MRNWIIPALLAAAAIGGGAVIAQSTLTEPAAPPKLDPPSISVSPPDEQPRYGDDQYRPTSGQSGKDVVWVPTPDSLVNAMLQTAGVTKDDYVVDLGSGDGRIAIAAAKLGARAHGIEYNPEMVALARRNAQRAGVANRATFAQADIFKSDFSDADVVTLYLLPSLNERLKPTLLKMTPGTRIVSHAFTMGDWEPDRTIRTDDATGYFWLVPAQLAGRWAFEVGDQRFTARLDQTYQRLASPPGGPIRDGRVAGTKVTLTRSDGRVLEGELRDGALVGGGWRATRAG